MRLTINFLSILFFAQAAFAADVDIGGKPEALDVYNQKIKGDSIAAGRYLDSARYTFNRGELQEAIHHAKKALQLSEKFPDSPVAIESLLISARSYKRAFRRDQQKSDLNNTLKYYIKAITYLESIDARPFLSTIYMEYGDFYAGLELTELTIKNYLKAFELLKEGDNYDFQKELLQKIAVMYYSIEDKESSIQYYEKLKDICLKLGQLTEVIDTRKVLSDLYRENKDFDQSISEAKELYSYYDLRGDQDNKIACLSRIGEISFEAENRDQADKAFKNYFRIVDKDDALKEREIASLRYVHNRIMEGDIYTWSTDNGYWSDYKTAIRYYNDAQKYTDTKAHPQLASTIFNRAGGIYFRRKEYKVCITYFELAVHYALKCNDLQAICENHIMLARAYDAIDRWKIASGHYELHASYKDSIIQNAEAERKAMAALTSGNEKKNMKIEETLDLIETQERQELALAQKELQYNSLQNELALIKQENELTKMYYRNELLAGDSAKRKYMLDQERIKNELNAKKIEQLHSDSRNQQLQLENQKTERKVQQQQIKLLEQENSLARSRQAYYVLSIVLISVSLVFIMIFYIQKRRANTILQTQNEKIEHQADKLKEAYQNLELLSTIGRDITSSIIIEEIIETVYENLNTLMDATILGIGVYDNEKHQLHFPGVRERNQRLSDINIDLRKNNSLAAHCFNYQEEIILDNYFESYGNYINPTKKPVPGDGNSTSIIYIPLTIGEKRLGVLTVQSFDKKAFNEYHINIVRNIAIYAKIALENANVYKELETQSISLQKANTNISQQNKLIEEQYQQLLSINEEKNNLIKILAHDLRNPLATAMSMTELVRFEKENLSTEQCQASEIIWRGLNRMNDMISKILDIKAIESQKINLDMELLNANELLQQLERMFAARAEEKSIGLHFSSSAEEPWIMADHNYLIQVLENLISNAIKFSPSQRSVFIHIADQDNTVKISVRDEGPGIPQSELKDLFKKYHRMTPRPTAGEQSIGLGLSIVKKFTEVMNGSVSCVSKEGVGTEFFVQFAKETVPVS